MSSRVLTYLFAGGGSGGHLFPGIAVAEELRRRDPAARCLFVGSDREIERRIVEENGLEHRALPVQPSTSVWRNPFRFAWTYWKSTREARKLLDLETPKAVIGLGGFASVPVARTARAGGYPLVLLEQNTVPGRASRWLAKRATAVCTSFEQTERDLPAGSTVEMTGNPVRRSIAELHDRPDGHEPPVLLVLGGSQGAVAVNDAVLLAVGHLGARLSGWRIVHQTGERDVDRVRALYERLGVEATVEAFFTDLVPWYRTATVAVARAGATSLAELACAGVPTILVPYPGAIHDHQTRNAAVYARAAAAWFVPQADDPRATAGGLVVGIEEALSQPSALRSRRLAMQSLAWPHAAEAVVDVIEKACWR